MSDNKQIVEVRHSYNYNKFMELGRYKEVDSYPHPRLPGREFVVLERTEPFNDELNGLDLTIYNGM